MIYLVKKSYKKLYLYRKRYFPLLLEMIIGISMIAVALNIVCSFQERVTRFQENVNNLYINISSNLLNAEASDVITSADNNHIKEIIANKNTLTTYYKKCYFKEASIDLLFVEESFFTVIMKSHDYDSRAVYIGSNALQKLNQYIDERYIYELLGFQILSFVPLENLVYESKSLLSDAFLSVTFDEKTFDDYIIFPIDAHLFLQEKCESNIVVADDNTDRLLTQVRIIDGYLESKYSNTAYNIFNYHLLAGEEISKNANIAELLNIISGFILIIVSFGLLGLLLIRVNRRRREFAISLMCGATRLNIMLEVYIELLSLVMIAVVVGNIICLPILSLIGNSGDVNYHGFTLVFCMLGGLLGSFIICLLPIIRIRFVSPLESLIES